MEKVLSTSKEVTKSDATFTWVDEPFLAENKVRPWADLPAWYPPPPGKDRVAFCSNARAIAKGLAFRGLDVTVRDLLAWYAANAESAPAPAPRLAPRIAPPPSSSRHDA